MTTCRRANLPVSAAIGVLGLALVWPGSTAAAPSRDDQDPAPRAASASANRDSPPSRGGDTPSSGGSGPSATTPSPSGSASGQPDDRRGDARHRSTSRGGGSRGRGWHGGGHWGGYYGPGYYYPYGLHWSWWGVWPGYVYVDGPYSRRRGDEAGALDIDVSPGRTEVWVDGNYVGTADDFDGFPTFLWLPRGTYDVAFYREGYRTLARQYSIYAGLIIDVEDRMEPGEATRPEDLVTKSTERRDARLRRDRELAEEVETRQQDETWRERTEAREETRPGSDLADGSATVSLRLRPRDASVYLDGRFLGTAEDLERLPNGFALEAGEHRLEMVRPGYVALRHVISVEPGEAAELDLALEREAD